VRHRNEASFFRRRLLSLLVPRVKGLVKGLCAALTYDACQSRERRGISRKPSSSMTPKRKEISPARWHCRPMKSSSHWGRGSSASEPFLRKRGLGRGLHTPQKVLFYDSSSVPRRGKEKKGVQGGRKRARRREEGRKGDVLCPIHREGRTIKSIRVPKQNAGRYELVSERRD